MDLERCPECGGTNVPMVRREGLLVRECALCGTVLGEDAAARFVRMVQEARERGVDPEVFPLVQGLESLPGLRVLHSHGGDSGGRSLPCVQWTLHGTGAAVQVENLAKTVALAQAELRLRWAIEVGYHSRLSFLLEPRVDQERIDARVIADARHDVQVLGRAVLRNQRLSWWLRAPG
jgi:hypothetical protein